MKHEMERKQLSFEVKADDDGDKGVVTAMFAQTGVVDRGGDVIMAGAFGEQDVVVSTYDHGSSIPVRGDLPVGKGMVFEKGDQAIAELQFFMNTESGREHFEVIKALGDLQQYSFGFMVTEEGELTDEFMAMGADRVIKKVKVLEVSPVLLGQGFNTGTLAVKSMEEEPSEEEIAAREELNRELMAEVERFEAIPKRK